MRIVIVEDEIKIRTGMAKLISRHTEHTIVGEAKNGQEGLEIILKVKPELVISDIRMPVMDGLEMLEKLKEADFQCHFVILSGYSEFEYAQKALRYGADDYLLKPLAAEDVTGLLESINRRVKEENKKTAETAEGIFRDLLSGGKRETEEDYRKLESAGCFEKERRILLLGGYVRNTSLSYIRTVEERLKEICNYYTFLENTQEIYCLLQEESFVRIQRRVYMNLEKKEESVWAAVYLKDIRELVSGGAKLRKMYPYSMCAGTRELLTEEKIDSLTFSEYEYPRQIENRIQENICKGRMESLSGDIEAFQNYVKEQSWEPLWYREAYGKLIRFMEGVCHEVNPEAYKNLKQCEAGKETEKAVTTGELLLAVEKAKRAVITTGEKKADIGNYTILRAICYIREHYGEDLSLEILGEHLDITPEYLSTLFNREVGINFSIFVKRFRISQAKRLLKGTDKKIYEIAQETGYRDPKYFTRVFKEETGVSPGEFRQIRER